MCTRIYFRKYFLEYLHPLFLRLQYAETKSFDHIRCCARGWQTLLTNRQDTLHVTKGIAEK